VSASGQNLVFGDCFGSIQPFCIEKGEYLRKCKSSIVHQGQINKLEISQDGKYLSTCSADKKIKLHKISDVEKFETVRYKELIGHKQWVWGTRFSCDSVFLISCSTDQTLKLWGVEKGELLKTLNGHSKGVICLALGD
jgi:G protein beta subunit-like protein